LAGRGFEICFPEDLSFQEQVALFRSASVVVGPNGSAMVNGIFAPAGAKLFLLSQRGLFNWGNYQGLMQELGFDPVFICGDEDTGRKHSNYQVPVERILAALDAHSV